VGFGSLGNIAAAWPLAAAAEAFGWRATVLALAALTLVIAVAIWTLVQDPPPAAEGHGQGRLVDLLRQPALWLILPLLAVQYAPAAGLRGLWIGPYLDDVFGATASGIGLATLVMALAMVAGNLAYGPLDRVFGTRKWVVLGGNLMGAACLAALALAPAAGLWTATLLLAAVGFFGASFPLIMAHGRSFFPPHLLGRGVTLMNLFAIGGVGLLQMASGRVHAAGAAAGGPGAGHAAVFGFFALCLLAGCLVYAFSRDRLD
jgi:predicted MFS family arabinose efflux permease